MFFFLHLMKQIVKMAVEYNGSKVTAIDMDSKIGYVKFFSEDSKFQYSGKEMLT